MPSQCQIDPDAQLGYVRLSGALSGKEFVQIMKELYESAAWQPGFAAIWDLSAVRELTMELPDVHEISTLARSLDTRMGVGRAAFVVPREIDHAMATLLIRMAKSEGRERRTFATLEDATAWVREERLPWRPLG